MRLIRWPSMGRQRRDWHTVILHILILTAFAYLWLLPLWNGFWLDECLAIWVGHGGFREIVPRALTGSQMVSFSILSWLLQQAGEVREPVFRLPSLGAGLATLYILYRLGTEVRDHEFGATLAALFATMPLVAPEIPNGRPYAIAVLAQAGGLLWLLRWLRSRRLREGMAWVLCSTISGYFHYLFLLPVLIEGLYVAFFFWRSSRDRFHQVVICGAATLVLALPMAPQLLLLLQHGRWVVSSSQPRWADLAQALFPPHLIFAVAVVVGIEWAAGSRADWKAAPGGNDAPNLGAWLLIAPVVVIFGIARSASMGLFIPRYMLTSLLGGILAWAWLIGGLRPQSLRRATVMVAAASGLIASSLFAAVPGMVVDYKNENWRTAAQAIPDSGQLLIYPGMVEAQRLDWLESPQYKAFFLAPLTIFRPSLSLQNSHIVPLDFAPAGRDYLQPVVQHIAATRERVTIVARDWRAGQSWVAWLSDQLRAAGFRKAQDSRHGGITVAVWMPAS